MLLLLLFTFLHVSLSLDLKETFHDIACVCVCCWQVRNNQNERKYAHEKDISEIYLQDKVDKEERVVYTCQEKYIVTFGKNK